MKLSNHKTVALRLALTLALSCVIIQPIHAGTVNNSGTTRPSETVTLGSIWESIVMWFARSDQSEQAAPLPTLTSSDNGCPPWVCNGQQPDPR